jgi:hypothetical protein
MNNIEQAKRALAMEATLEERCKELMKIKGNMRGELLRSNFVYLKKKEGDKAIQRMENKLKQLGYPLNFNEIKTFEWYEDPFCSIFMLAFQEEFNWKEQDIFNLGRFSPQYSMIVKIALRYLVSLRKSFNFGPNLRRRNVDYGDLEPYQFNEKEKYMIFRLKKYALHPLVCIYIKGYLTSLFEQVVGRDKIKVEETECVFKNNDYHEYKVIWE